MSTEERPAQEITAEPQPRGSGSPPPPQESAEPGSRDRGERAWARAMRILVADDNDLNRQIVVRIFERLGVETGTSRDGREAVETALSAAEAGKPFDAILMDMQMPVMDGYEATRLLREKGYDHPIIALTANVMPADRERCFAAGCTDYAAKPIRRAQLVEQVRRVISAP